MPRPSQRTHSLIKKRVKTPGGRRVIHYVRRKRGVPVCSICGRPLGGVPWTDRRLLKRMARTDKRPERMYGGTICPSCLAKLIRLEARLQG